MIKRHIDSKADCTISVLEVDIKEASRFGILEVDEDDNITKFVEKPKEPKSNLASMGVYIFTYKSLRQALIEDSKDPNSEHDFGKNIIPNMLGKKQKLVAFRFKGYWRDVGTIDSLHQASMELLPSNRTKDTIRFDTFPTIFSEDTNSMPQYIGKDAIVEDCLINQGARIYGDVKHSVISNEVVVENGAKVINSVLMPGVKVKKGAIVENAILGPNTIIKEKEKINVGTEKIVLLDYERSLQ